MTLNQTSGDALILVYLCIHFGQDCELDLVSYFYFNSILTSLNMTFKKKGSFHNMLQFTNQTLILSIYSEIYLFA